MTKGESNPQPGQEGAATSQDHPGNPTKEHHKILMLLGNIEADSVPMSVLVNPLTVFLGRTVVDKTGLTGNYNFTLRWTSRSIVQLQQEPAKYPV
jgi:uncharacterized protein (TIGR03435 family)